jgi:outer membrane biosynthesis protein TonB
VTFGSSLPPLKKNDGKYGLIALLLLLAAGGLWFFLRAEDSEPPVEVTEPEAPTREQFAPEIEIPEGDAGLDETEGEEPRAKPRQTSQIHPSDWDCRGTLAAAELTAIIRGQPSKQVQTCYERRLKDDNLLQGSMRVLLTIGANGNVRAVSVDGTLNDRQVYSCVKRVAKTWKFPKPRGGCVRTEVPFQMTPKL